MGRHACGILLCVKWTVTGKVSDVTRTAGSQKPDLHFDYDAMGQRIAKTVTNKNTTDGTDKFVTTYYVRDPQGNVLAVYEHKHGDSDNGTFTLTEQHLYGAGRLGMRKRDLALNATNASESTPVTHYELTNHLGNVLAVISDEASTTAEPTVVSLSDYYPFGMTEPGRSWNSGDYRFGYTGHEKEEDLASGVYTTEYRLLDTRLGRWLSVDPLGSATPNTGLYVYCGGNPIAFWDPDGRIQKNPDESYKFDPIEYGVWAYGGGEIAPGFEYMSDEHFEALKKKFGIQITKEEAVNYGFLQAFKATLGYLYYDDGTPLLAYKAEDGNMMGVMYDKRTGDYSSQPGHAVKHPDQKHFDNSYNCGGKLAGRQFTIFTDQIKFRKLCKKDNYRVLKRKETVQEGDLGIYYKRGKVKHIELFEANNVIDTKGGGDEKTTESYDKAGKDPQFNDCKYKIIRKKEKK